VTEPTSEAYPRDAATDSGDRGLAIRGTGPRALLCGLPKRTIRGANADAHDG